MTDTTEIVIIGAGIAGLSAGCYAQMCGYQTRIFEQNSIPGGLCASQTHQGYTFDSGLYAFLGIAPGQPFYQVWKELGVISACQFLRRNEFIRITDTGDQTLVVHADPERLESHLKIISPQDAGLIEDFCAGVRRFMSFDLSLLQHKPKALMNGGDWARLGRRVLPFARPMAKWGGVALGEFAQRFQSPFLRRAIAQLVALPSMPVMVAMAMLAYNANGNLGIPAEGAGQIADTIAARYQALGGQIQYNATVSQILVNQDRAVGVRLGDGGVYHSDRVIAAGDGYHTLFKLLAGQYPHRSLTQLYQNPDLTQTRLQVTLGLNQDLADQPIWTTHLLSEPLAIAGEFHQEFNVRHYSHARTLSPPGKSIVALSLSTRHPNWENLSDSAQRSAIAPLLDQFMQRYSVAADSIDCLKIITPYSYSQQTSNWQGSICGWALSKETLPLMVKGISKTLSPLKGLHLAGQWVEPGGSLPVVALSGRNAVRLICTEDGRPFLKEAYQSDLGS